MSELRLYLRRDSLAEEAKCPWVVLDAAGRIADSGTSLDKLPQARRCHLVLASDLVLCLPVQLPDLPDRKLRPLLPAAAEAASLTEAEQLHVALGGREGDGRRILNIVDKAWFGRILTALRERGILVDAALPEALLLPWQPDAWTLLRDEDGAAVRFNQYRGGALDRGDPPPGLVLALAQAGRPASIRVCKGNALKAPDLGHWSEALGLPVEDAGVWDWRVAPWPAGADLLQGEFAARRTRVDWPALLRPAGWAMAALVAVQMAGTVVDWRLLDREAQGLKTEMRLLAEKALPAHAAVVDPAWQVAQELKAIGAGGEIADDSLPGLLARLGKAWPAGSDPGVQTMDFVYGVLNVGLARNDADWLERLKANASAAGLALALRAGDKGGAILTVKALAGPDPHGANHGR